MVLSTISLKLKCTATGHDTHSGSIVPNRDIILVPLEPRVHLLSCRNNFCEVSDDSIAFGLRDSHDLCDEARIEKQTVPASDRVCPDERMFCGNRISTDRSTKSMRVRGLHIRRV